MKFILYLILITQFTALPAQEATEVSEINKTFSKGDHTAFSVIIPNAKLKDVVSDWKKYLHRSSKVKINEINGELIIPKIIIPEISTDSITIYTLINANSSDVQLLVFISGNDSVFYSSALQPGYSSNIHIYLKKFADDEYRSIVKDELSVEQKKLKNLENELDDLEKNNEQSEKKIKANERSIDRMKDEIKNNNQLKDIKTEAITQQQKILITFLAPSDQKKDEEKKLKALEKEKKKVENQIESLYKEIEDNESDNKSLQKKIEHANSDLIPDKKSEIGKQKKIVNTVEDKLKGIG